MLLSMSSVSTVVGMIEHGIVEASSYAPSRVLSPTLRTVGDFVEVCYSSDKAETSLLDSQIQAAVQSSSHSPPCSNQNGLTTSSCKNVGELFIGSETSSDALTFISCEVGSVGDMTDTSEIVVCDRSPSSSGDATVKFAAESPGVHSTHLKTEMVLSDTVVVPASSKAATEDILSTEITREKTSASEVGCETVHDTSIKAGSVVDTCDDTDAQANDTSTQMKTTNTGTMWLRKI